jgi:hypothetical protein
MPTPIEMLQGALAKLATLDSRVLMLETKVTNLESKLIAHAQHIRALEQGAGDCVVGGTPT